MNTVSLFIYFADTLGKVQEASGFFTIIFFIAFVISIIVRVVCASAMTGPKADDDAKGFYPTSVWMFRWALSMWVTFFLLWGVLPREKTLYAIAASQMGEAVIKSDAVQGITSDATKALQAWIKNQIEPPVKAEKKDK